MTRGRDLALAPLVVLLLAALAPSARAQSAKTQLEDPVLAQRFNDISNRLVCQCGCGMTVRACSMQNCGSATPIRREIERELTAGETNDEIVQNFVDENGIKILSSPPPEGFNLAAWIMPGFALFLGLIAVVFFATRWAAKRRLAAASSAPATVDPDVLRRIERELNDSE